MFFDPCRRSSVAFGNLKGQTPAVVPLARKRTHIVRLELDGYQPYEATIIKSASGSVWGNIVFGGLIGLVVYAASGGLYKLSPVQVAGQLGKSSAIASRATDCTTTWRCRRIREGRRWDRCGWSGARF